MEAVKVTIELGRLSKVGPFKRLRGAIKVRGQIEGDKIDGATLERVIQQAKLQVAIQLAERLGDKVEK